MSNGRLLVIPGFGYRSSMETAAGIDKRGMENLTQA